MKKTLALNPFLLGTSKTQNPDFGYVITNYISLLTLYYSRYNVQAVFKVTDTNGWDMKQLAESEVRIIILYCTQNEASQILQSAQKSNLTSNKYLWLVTQSVIGDPFDRSVNRRALPVGMLGE